MFFMDRVARGTCFERTRRVAAAVLLAPLFAAAQAVESPWHAEAPDPTAERRDGEEVVALLDDSRPARIRYSASVEVRQEPVVDRQALTRLGAPELGGRAETSSIGYRWWASSGRVALGLGVGTVTHSVVAPAIGTEPERLTGQTGGPAVTVGWRLQLSDRSTIYADTSASQGLGENPAAAYYTTRGGVEWKTRKSRLGFDRGSVAMQLDSGYRLSLRTRRGGVALVLRGSF